MSKLQAKQAKWMQHPTKNQMILVVTVQIIGSFLLLLATSNLFTESPFQRNNIVLMLLLIPALIATIKVCKNYFSNKRAQV